VDCRSSGPLHVQVLPAPPRKLSGLMIPSTGSASGDRGFGSAVARTQAGARACTASRTDPQVAPRHPGDRTAAGAVAVAVDHGVC